MDDLLRRLRLRSAVVALALIAAAAAVRPGWRAPAGVGCGALLSAISVASIAGGVADLPERRSRGLLKITGRYALLGFLAYVMIARLRLPPLALITGASSLPVALAIEAGRLLTRK